MSHPESMVEQNETLQPPKPDFREGLKSIDSEFVRVLKKREGEMRDLVKERHGIRSLDYMPYHGGDPDSDGHINKVADRNVLIMQAFFEAKGEPQSEEEEREREEALVFAHYMGQIHDGVQHNEFMKVSYDKESGKETIELIEGDWKKLIGQQVVRRQRRTKDNELDTFKEELEFTEGVNNERTQKGLPSLFTTKHKQWLTRSLMVTIPEFKENTVYQPELREDDDELAHATAWSDLKGGIFMDGFEQFFKEGDQNLLEDYPDILEVVLHPDAYDEEVKRGMAERIRKWRDGQIQFTQAQWDQLQVQVKRFPYAEGFLKEKVFKDDVYDQTLEKVRIRAAADKDKTPDQLLSELRKIVIDEMEKYPEVA